ncbi:MAG: hypothetical protein EPO24_15740, partial [Bacteroidetes bacterium]
MAVNNPVLSVLVPSRERAVALKFSLDSLGLARNNIEVLIWVDNDDPQVDEYRRLFGKDVRIKLFIEPRVGYRKFHIMQNFLASRASGDWLYLWNDDAYMDSVEWYDTFIDFASLSNPKEEPVVYNVWGQGSNKNFFPIVSIKYFKLLGHTSEHCICDVWVRDVAYDSHIQKTIFGIRPRHRKFGFDDDKLGDLKDNTSKTFEVLISKSHHLGALSHGVYQGKANDTSKILDWVRKSSNRGTRVGFVGLGKLGLPVALAIESRGKNVVAYDTNPQVKQFINDKAIPFQEEGSAQ